MRDQANNPGGCNEEFAMLCALSTSGELSTEEQAALDEHIAHCPSCTSLLSEYLSLAHVGMARLAAERMQEGDTPFGHGSEKAEERSLDAFPAPPPSQRIGRPSRASLPVIHHSWKPIRRVALAIALAASFLFAVRGAYEIGQRTPGPTIPPTIATVTSSAAKSERETHRLRFELAAAGTSLKQLALQVSQADKHVVELSGAKTELVAQIADLTQKNNSAASSLVSVTLERDALQQQLTEASAALTHAREDLNRAQQDRQGALYRAAALEAQMNDLNVQLAHVNNATSGEEKFLQADRDIRELMGARQLYIADVFDVQRNGERSKPFGRVFYTKGKSLIFYAFDLQKQPGYHEANTFQAWGQPANSSGKPLSLGIFYEDNEQNRRWVVKSDSPEVLAQINAVFVTVEPRGGSTRPTGKPFLEAYLHSLPPNHP